MHIDTFASLTVSVDTVYEQTEVLSGTMFTQVLHAVIYRQYINVRLDVYSNACHLPIRI